MDRLDESSKQGSSPAIGRRVVSLLAAADDVASVLAIERRSVQGGHPKVDHRVVDLRRAAELTEMPELATADTVVHLPFAAR